MLQIYQGNFKENKIQKWRKNRKIKLLISVFFWYLYLFFTLSQCGNHAYILVHLWNVNILKEDLHKTYWGTRKKCENISLS